MFQLATAVLAVNGLLSLTSAHQCRDGSRVTCTEVQSTKGMPSTNGEGYDAEGYPTCTPAGERVFCLFDHDYHRCSGDKEPCCMDGSSPSHRHSFSGDDHNLECSVASTMTATSMETQAANAMQATEPIILDDMDSGLGSEMANAYEGSFRPCMEDAYNGQFHHDWSRNKGDSSFTFKFNPPSDGCYAIEEHHPGSNPACSQYLPTNAHVDIDRDQGTHRLYFNQAQNGGKWTKIGSMSLEKGKETRLIMRSGPEEDCHARGNCFWVVDAFRLTWTGSQCAPASAEKETVHQQYSVSPVQRDEVQGEDSKEGVLSLHVSWMEGHLHRDDSLHLKLQNHGDVIATTLAAHLGYKTVKIMDYVKVGTVRGAVALDVGFIAQGQLSDPFDHGTHARRLHIPKSIQEELQVNLDAVGAGVAVKWACVYGVSYVYTGTVAADQETNIALYVGIGSAAAFVLLGIATFFVLKLRKSMRNSKNAEVVKPQVVVVGAAENPKDLEKMADDLDNASVSTPSVIGEPMPSEDGTHSDGISVTSLGLKTEEAEEVATTSVIEI